MTPWQLELEAMRQAWATRERTFQGGPALPLWARLRPELVRSRAAWRRLQECGEVVFASVLVADSVLFEPGETCATARLAWSPDPQVLAWPEQLRELRERFLHLRTHGSRMPGLRQYARLAQDSDHRPRRAPLPPLLSGSALVFEQEVLVDPRQLPGGRIAHPEVPVVVDLEGGTDGAFLLPASMWSPQLRARW